MAIVRLMLRDFVIVREMELNLESGFTALTGETGAGKSILIDALQMALGERASTQVIREGASRAEVSVEWGSTPSLRTWLNAAGFEASPDDTETLLLRRQVDDAGKSRAWINGSPATATQLRELAPLLVDIHGQHAWAMLTKPDSVRQLLDAYARIDTAPLKTAWDSWRLALSQLEKARTQQGTQAVQRERLQWCIAEVDKLNPQAGEWEQINQEHARLSHAQGLLDASHAALSALEGAEHLDTPHHATKNLHQALQALQTQSHIESAFTPLIAELESALAITQDTAHALHAYLARTDLDPARLQYLDARLADWLALARRNKCEPDALHPQLQTWRADLAELDATSDLSALQTHAQQCAAVYDKAAKQVRANRAKHAPLLAKAITQAMQTLSMAGGRFEVELTPLEQPAAYGLESVSFLVAAHAGVNVQPVGKIASGGELARIALALAVTTSKLGSAPTLIFDEVDAGIGGATAHTVGRLMRQLGADRQVLAVTHLAQVASCAHQHEVVSKVQTQGQTSSHIHRVSAEARVMEIARMLGGDSALAGAHAQEMLDKAQAS